MSGSKLPPGKKVLGSKPDVKPDARLLTKKPSLGLFSKLSLKTPKPAELVRKPESSGRGPDASLVDVASLDDLLILQTIGTGTFGRVLLAKHKPTGRFVALKCMKKHEIVRMKQVEHVLSEAALLKEIQHPFVISLYSTFQDERKLYMLMEYSPGGEIFTHLRRAGRFPTNTAKYYAASVLLALEFMHSRDIVYRDLKPENLLLDRNGLLKMTDFGFAKRVPDRTWTLCGTPEYLAPEIIQSKGHGLPVDWWALGVLLFEMIAGYPPFYEENPFKIYQKILVGKVNYPLHFHADAKDLCRRLLEADRSKRYGAMRGGADDIKKHVFFNRFDFTALLNGDLPVPIRPEVKGDDDVHNFESYPESVESEGEVINKLDVETNNILFKNF